MSDQLKAALARVLDESGETRPVLVLIDRLVDRFPRVSTEIAADVLRFVFYPCGSRALHHVNQVNLPSSLTRINDHHL